MTEHICFKRRKISYLEESDSLEYSDSDNENKININDEIDNKDDNSLKDILNNINKLNIDTNKYLVIKIINKIDNLEKKVDILSLVNIKIDTLKKDIDKILVEKDYIIENLKYEINDLKDQLKESKFNDSLSQRSTNTYFS